MSDVDDFYDDDSFVFVDTSSVASTTLVFYIILVNQFFYFTVLECFKITRNY